MVCLQHTNASRTWILVFVVTSHFVVPYTAECHSSQAKQQTPRNEATQSTPRQVDPDVTDWAGLLESLYVETKLLESDEQKSLLTAEIADAFWTVNRTRSKELFRLALDAALSMPPSASKTSSISRILMLVAQRDRGFQRELQKQLIEQKTSGAESSSEALRVARSMLETDAGLAS